MKVFALSFYIQTLCLILCTSVVGDQIFNLLLLLSESEVFASKSKKSKLILLRTKRFVRSEDRDRVLRVLIR